MTDLVNETQDKKDLIIVDTSGRHKQEEALFEEMRQVLSLLFFVRMGRRGMMA
jgi:signal recognition particle GTPase